MRQIERGDPLWSRRDMNPQRPPHRLVPARSPFLRVESAGVEVWALSPVAFTASRRFYEPRPPVLGREQSAGGESGLSSGPQARCLPTPF